ncbi:hypothetical protein [Roseicyclus mahoneyensis]|jgi:hypothetical protein|uniref:Uncharacterized protein n=1 Tax=Roseicyclus mahoneyensis TaxID=164332 RepID=A0A316GJ68_9RHOB|nr:hypothetical protein [Roseicyclus mahoneyensis]PWK60841.1 hypothetical protein C7455_10339 [Roseicyclus mahoneyensis]
MTGYTRHDLPCDIVVHAGHFTGQPEAFAHLLTACPALDLGHVEVIRDRPSTRLRARFAPDIADEIAIVGAVWNTLILILPAAYDGLDCPLTDSRTLPYLGTWRGHVPRMVPERPAP